MLVCVCLFVCLKMEAESRSCFVYTEFGIPIKRPKARIQLGCWLYESELR